MADIAAMTAAVCIFASGFAAATYLGVKGHPGLAVFVLVILACVRISSKT